MALEDNFDDFVTSLEKQFIPSEETVSQAIDTIRASLRDYVEARNLNSLVIALHGDIDSMVVAALCQEKYTGVPLLGIVIQSKYRTNQAHWSGRNFCTAYHDPGELLVPMVDMGSLKEYMTFERALPDMHGRLVTALLQDTAQKANGIVLGSNTWSDTFATFLTSPADYNPIEGINKGFELPVFAKQLKIAQNVIDDPADAEAHIGATYREIDVIINGSLGNLDNNLSTQLARFRSLEKIQKVILRYNLNESYLLDGVDRADINFPSYFSF